MQRDALHTREPRNPGQDYHGLRRDSTGIVQMNDYKAGTSHYAVNTAEPFSLWI